MRRLPVITLAVLVAAVVVQLWPGAASALVYDRQRVLCGEAWRLISATWVHFSASHFLYDVLAFGMAGALIELRGYKLFGLFCLLSPVVVGCAVLVGARDTSIFGGLSGLATGAVTFLCLHGLREHGLWKMICAATLAIVAGKIAIEWATQDMIFAHSGSVALKPMPVAHLAGVAAAFACCVRFPALKPRESKAGAVSGIAARDQAI
jgi:rhomboid family GlyGly-CTERM serine protease